jgi:ABC-type phosphate transport system substrate-binding protein
MEKKTDMKTRRLSSQLHITASALALSAATAVGLSAVQPANAAAISTGIYGGGSTLSSLAMRQLFDCYAGVTVAHDNYAFSPSFPAPGLLPTSCLVHPLAQVEGLFATVGSGSGLRAYIANSTRNLLSGAGANELPLDPPPFIDTNNPHFVTYPYPELDFGASDAPLPGKVGSNPNTMTTVSNSFTTGFTNWQTFTAGHIIPTTGSKIVNYSTAKYGQPVQIPVFEVPVAIMVNVSQPITTGVNWQIKSALAPQSLPGSAIQLTGAQLCAIFSGQVRSWGDATTKIIYLNKSGTQLSELFYAANSGKAAGHVTPVPYATTANPTSGFLPITVVYRSDGSGHTFIMTNFLANYCPLLDNGLNNYKKIFTGLGIKGATQPNLPSTKFTDLIANIKAVGGIDVTASTYNFGHPWLGFSGADGTSVNLSAGRAQAGYIGYVSADYTVPYAKTVTGLINDVRRTVPAPRSASIQNDQLRFCGVYHPGDTPAPGACQAALGKNPQNFVPPSPATTDNAWKSLKFPQATWTWADWNIYGQTWPAGTTLQGTTIPIGGLSILPLAKVQGAYPVSGTTFLDFYSCYHDPAGKRVPAIRQFLNWHLGASFGGAIEVNRIIQNNGFHELPAIYAHTLWTEYVVPSAAHGTVRAISAWRPSGAQIDGCIGVNGGGAL